MKMFILMCFTNGMKRKSLENDLASWISVYAPSGMYFPGEHKYVQYVDVCLP